MIVKTGLRGKTFEERFWLQVDVRGPDECWPWIGAVSDKGYGRMTSSDPFKKIKSHRAAHIIQIGPVPKGLLVCHHCDNPRCCNGRHLYAGTSSDNVRDAYDRGRARSPFLRPEIRAKALETKLRNKREGTE